MVTRLDGIRHRLERAGQGPLRYDQIFDDYSTFVREDLPALLALAEAAKKYLDDDAPWFLGDIEEALAPLLREENENA